MVESFKRRLPQTYARRVQERQQYDYHTSTANPRWRRLSAEWIKRYPFCILCLAHGRTNDGATEFALNTQRNLIVDHITPHRGDATLYWDQDNWETLCRYPCHDKDKQACEQQGKDWWALVRSVVAEKQTQGFIEQHREWIPEHVWSAICV